MSGIFTGIKNTIHSNYVKTVSTFINPEGPSRFLEDGTLTPEEFFQAGELLTYKCPSWTWESGDPSKVVPYLPADKQYLVTRKVHCHQRAQALVESAKNTKYSKVDLDGTDDGWVAPELGEEEPIGEIEIEGEIPAPVPVVDDDSDSDGDIPDMEDFDEDNLVEDDPAALSSKPSEENQILKMRTYDLHITYDRYYKTPRVWLFGYDEDGNPLKPKLIFQDISQDHAHKTVTIDEHPHLGIPFAYIHPCNHASVMKKICDRLAQNGKELRVDQYMFLFLKFISAVIPTIDYDFTMAMDG